MKYCAEFLPEECQSKVRANEEYPWEKIPLPAKAGGKHVNATVRSMLHWYY